MTNSHHRWRPWQAGDQLDLFTHRFARSENLSLDEVSCVTNPRQGGHNNVAQENQSVTYQRQYRRCSKPDCKGCPHGPYWYAYWRDGNKVRSRYIGKTLPNAVINEVIDAVQTPKPIHE
jgi:hypothetical protein